MADKQSIISRLNHIQVGAPNHLLVFETDGFTLYGGLAHTGITALEFRALGQSQALDFATAVGEVLEQLRGNSNKRLPTKAVLITPTAASALLELPVNPEKPRPDAQMSELVRWELEPLFAQQNEIWVMGALLMGRGYIDAAQRRQIAVQQLADREGHSPGSAATVRFGEVAQDLGYVSGKQIEECLALQEKLVLFDDEVACGWVSQVVSDEEPPEQFPWLAAGVGEGMRKQWAAAFRRQGVFLRWIYPQPGAAFGALAPDSDREQILVDIRQEQFAVLRGRPGGLASLRIERCPDGLIGADDVAGICQEQMRPDIERVHLAVADGLFEQFSPALAQRLEREIVPPPLPGNLPDAKLPQQVLASMAGVATHYFGHCDAKAAPRVVAQPPKLAIWKRRELWPYAAGLAVLIGIAGHEAFMRIETWQNQKELAALEQEFEQKLASKKRTQGNAAEIARLTKQIDDKTASLQKKRVQLHTLKELVLERQALVPGLLRALAESMGDEVLLDVVEEGAQQSGFHLVGWALTDTAGQLFLSRLNKALDPWGYKVLETQVRSGEGRLGVRGSTLEVWVSPAIDKKGRSG